MQDILLIARDRAIKQIKEECWSAGSQRQGEFSISMTSTDIYKWPNLVVLQ